MISFFLLALQDARIEETFQTLRALVEVTGVSTREGPVREALIGMLPAGTPHEVDAKGNLIVGLGPQGSEPVLFVAHMDETGFTVTEVREDGQLATERRGGFYLHLFEDCGVLVHGSKGPVPGITRRGPAVPEERRRSVLVDLGCESREAAAALGVAVGDAVAIPKRLLRLSPTRVAGRSLDDRVGCAAQVLALRRLDAAKLRREVVFAFVVEEETGLRGAQALAERLSAEGRLPRRVHAVDTFVSADSPLETTEIAQARLGEGAVIRAIDNTTRAPQAEVDRVLALAKARGIPLSAGETRGGNDGSKFETFGVVNVPLAWPLRSSHSPVETMDLRDLVALADLLQALAQQ